MFLECITVSVNYSDFLCWLLPINRCLFDNWVIVTSTADKKTHRLCEYWGVKCVKVDLSKEKEFNKGRLINIGLEHLQQKDWVLHLDSDIILPPNFRRVIEKVKLDADALYTIDRLMCKDFDAFLSFWMNPRQYENGIFVHCDAFPFGVRLSSELYDGFLILGFFQLWNQKHKKLKYSEQHKTAARTDVQFSLNFPREKRYVIPECLGIHIETSIKGRENEMGLNWSGRQTELFQPKYWNGENKVSSLISTDDSL